MENRTAPSVGSRLTLRISDIAFGGEGVGRVDDFVVFVPFAIQGELVEVELTELKKRYARARLVSIIERSSDRVEPACRYFAGCGGCQYQHVAYPTQLQVKWKQVVDLFQRVGGFHQAVVHPVTPCPQPYGYRNRIMVRSQWDKFKQGLNIGFLRHDNRLVVDVEECKIADPLLNQKLREVRAKPPPKGGLKVVLRVHPEGWRVPKDSFFQNNFLLLPALVEAVRNGVRSSAVRHVLDVYCGVGFFSLELADLVDSFLGIELDRVAVQAARENADLRQVRNGEYLHGGVDEILPNVLDRFPAGRSAVVLDPPRRGCARPTLELLRAVQPAQILYVSCHPATLARDVSILCEDGKFCLHRVTPFDMFPQTQHVECVVDLRRPAPGSSDHQALGAMETGPGSSREGIDRERFSNSWD